MTQATVNGMSGEILLMATSESAQRRRRDRATPPSRQVGGT